MYTLICGNLATMRARIPGSIPASTVGQAPRRSSPDDRAFIGDAAQVREIAHQLAHAQQDSRALLGHAHRAPDAHDQRHADLALQRVDLLCNRGGGDVQHARRGRHRAADRLPSRKVFRN